MVKYKEQLSLGLNLEDYLYDGQNCTAQRCCQWIDLNFFQGVDFSHRCPPWQKEQLSAYGAMGKGKLVVDLATGKFDYSNPTLRDIVYKCMLCGACDTGCKRNLDLEPQLMLESLRARLVEKGYGPMPQHVKPTENIEKTRNLYGKEQKDRLNWMPKDVTPVEKADLLYFAGCRSSFNNTEISTATARILNAANASFMVMKDEPCCGHFVFITGQVEKARKIANENLELIRGTGAKTVVVSCAECLKSIKVDYPKLLGFSTLDLGFEVVHITELVDKWLKEGALKPMSRVEMTVAFHDSCNLGRMSEPWFHWEGTRGHWGLLNPPREVRRGVGGIYEQPRDILKAIPGIELVEMLRRRENAWCCGNDGGVKEAYPDFALWTASERLREAAVTGAEAIVAGCPGCKENLLAAAKNGMKVYDITELVARAIGK